MAVHRLLNNFTGGEISPQLDARTDLQKYETSCRTLENMRPLPWGGASFRAGTLFVAPTKYSDKVSRLVPFNFSTTQTFIIEMGNRYMRFFKDGAAVVVASAATWVTASSYVEGQYVTDPTDGLIYFNILAWNGGTVQPHLDGGTHWVQQTAYEIITPFLEAELFAVQFKEINDVLYLVHPLHQPQKLTRLSATNWTIGEVLWKYPAFLDENTTLTKLLNITPTVATSLVAGVSYSIASTGSTDFTLIGAANSNEGTIFTASGPGTGTGTALPRTVGQSVPLVANFDIFAAGHVGAYFELRHLRDSTTLQCDLSLTSGSSSSGTIKVKGDWTLTTSQLWYGDLLLQRSTDNGATWEVYRKFSSASNHNVQASGTENTEVMFQLSFFCAGDPYGASVWVGTAPNSYVKASAVLEVADAYIAGVVRITSVGGARAATANIVYAVEKADATWTWSEGAWSDYRGFPRAVGFYEQRMLYAGTTSKPNTLWGSVAADFENFGYSDLDDAAVANQFADTEQNPIEWLSALLRIHAGSGGGEYIVASGNTDEPMTPSNVTVRRQSSYGCAASPALTIDNGILFLQRQGRRIREMREMSTYQNPADFVAPDLTLMAEHITLGGITQMDFARLPDPQVYCIRADGQMPVMTYNREQNITAWARYVTQGNFESVAAVYGSPSDVVYIVTKRTLNGVTARQIEVFTAAVADKVNGVWLDCASQVVNGSPSTAVSGLTWLKNTAVTIVADGVVITGKTVSSTGTLTLDNAATVVNVGLAYNGTVKPMRIDMQMANGTSQGRKRRISEVVARFKDTLGCNYGNSLTNDPANGLYMAELPFREDGDAMDASPPLFTGDKVLIPWEGGNDLDGDVLISQQQPLPMTVLGLFVKFEVFGE